ncbi:hypothetical protein [Pseudescherichia sp.]|uniref:hypothetical protein n=1 Tax=Pseudescherichia sp. TaxID=2055881 RepID=UPI00289BA358|nr:hypothetical protein [Pseudescherichia sp.]
MAKMSQQQLIDILDVEDIDITKLRGANSLEKYKEQLFRLLTGDVISVNSLAKLSWHTVAKIKKELAL